MEEKQNQLNAKNVAEVKMIGWNKDHKVWIFGDCAVDDSGKIILPDLDKIIWCQEQGFKFSGDSSRAFMMNLPELFPGLNHKEAKELLANMDWNQERIECGVILDNAKKIFHASYGDHSGYLHMGMILSFFSHPELQALHNSKASLWISGEKGSGKTIITKYGMRILGFTRLYTYVTCFVTTAGLRRALVEFSGLPLHVDEWRNKDVSENFTALIRSCFIQNGATVCKNDGVKNTAQVTPMTVPVISGEDNTWDAAAQSRFVQLRIDARKRNHYIANNLVELCEDLYRDYSPEIREQILTGDTAKAAQCLIEEMDRSSDELYRIGRFVLKHRKEYVGNMLRKLEDVSGDEYLKGKITNERLRFAYSVAIASFITIQEMLGLQVHDEAGLVKSMVDAAIG